jgi:TrmH family RNA methyltransferase
MNRAPKPGRAGRADLPVRRQAPAAPAGCDPHGGAEVFANPRSDRVKAVRAAVAGRSGHGPAAGTRAVAEGPQAVREALAASREGAPDRGRSRPGPSVMDLWLTPAWANREPGFARAATLGGGHVHLATTEVIDAMSPTAQGVLALLDWPPVTWAQGLEVARGAASVVALFEEIRDPGNAGTVIRAADVAGAAAVVFSEGSVDPRSTKVIRASVGSCFHVPVVAGVALGQAVTDLRGAGYRILAADGAGRLTLDALLDPGAPAVPDLRGPVAWVFGNEARGLSEAAKELADATVRIPIYGRAESLNLAMAATLCLYESARMRRHRP